MQETPHEHITASARQPFHHYCSVKTARRRAVLGSIAAATSHIPSPSEEHRGACSDAPKLPTALPVPLTPDLSHRPHGAVTMETDNPHNVPLQKTCAYFNPRYLQSVYLPVLLLERTEMVIVVEG